MTTAEMKFIQKMTEYIWSDIKHKEKILQELKDIPILDKISDYKNWTDQVSRMSRSRMLKLMGQYTVFQRKEEIKPDP